MELGRISYGNRVKEGSRIWGSGLYLNDLKFSIENCCTIIKARYFLQALSFMSRSKTVYPVITQKFIKYNWKSVSYSGFLFKISWIGGGLFH